MIVGLVLIMRLAIHMLRITCYIMGMLTTIKLNVQCTYSEPVLL